VFFDADYLSCVHIHQGLYNCLASFCFLELKQMTHSKIPRIIDEQHLLFWGGLNQRISGLEFNFNKEILHNNVAFAQFQMPEGVGYFLLMVGHKAICLTTNRSKQTMVGFNEA
jgi:hypothetical protein